MRRIYKEISGSERADNWHPFQVICPNCGRIATTEVTAYDGSEVTYRCLPDFARSCTIPSCRRASCRRRRRRSAAAGTRARCRRFNGNGKLPWKLEWCAKWHTFPVTIEGAGRDHSTKGGSRDVAAACLKEIFGQEPPLNCPYDFFLVGGAKMSSSKGIGVTSRDMADFLPPEVLRFLMIRTPPRQHVNFEPSEVHIIKAFNEFDRAKQRYFHDANLKPDDKRVYEISQVTPEPDYWAADFQLVTALIQMPHLDAVKELEKRKGSPFTELERKHLDLRIRAAKYWLEHYATEEEKTRLQETLPARASELVRGAARLPAHPRRATCATRRGRTTRCRSPSSTPRGSRPSTSPAPSRRSTACCSTANRARRRAICFRSSTAISSSSASPKCRRSEREFLQATGLYRRGLRAMALAGEGEDRFDDRDTIVRSSDEPGNSVVEFLIADDRRQDPLPPRARWARARSRRRRGIWIAELERAISGFKIPLKWSVAVRRQAYDDGGPSCRA